MSRELTLLIQQLEAQITLIETLAPKFQSDYVKGNVDGMQLAVKLAQIIADLPKRPDAKRESPND